MKHKGTGFGLAPFCCFSLKLKRLDTSKDISAMNTPRRIILFLLFLCLSTFAQMSFAQTTPSDPSGNFNFGFGQQPQAPQAEQPKAFNPYDKKYRPRPQVQTSGRRALVGEADLKPHILRPTGLRESDMILRLSAGKTVTGCLHKDNQAVEITRENEVMKIKVTGGAMAPDEKTVRYSQYQCDVKTGVSAADIPLNRDDLLADQIKTISLQSENGSPLVTLKLDITPEKITFTEDKGLSRSKEKLFEQVFWFYPKGTRVLYTTAQDKSETTMAMMRTLARSNGLTPLEEVLPGFSSESHKHGKIYVVDAQARYEGADETAILLGEIDMAETFFGPQGPYERLIKKPVYLKNPGLYE
jgi:hypothetical protein